MKLVETIAKYEGIELREFCSRSENLNPPLSPAFSARTALGLPDRHNGHCTLGFRGDPIVLGSDQVPARLGSPRRFANCAAETRYTPWHLGVGPERGFFWVHVSRVRGGKLGFVEEQKAILRWQHG